MGEIKDNGDLFLLSFGVTVIRFPSRLQTVHNHFNNKGDGSIYGETFRYLAHYNGSFYGQFEISQCLSNQADHSLHAINFLSEKNVHGRQSSHLLKPCSHL